MNKEDKEVIKNIISQLNKLIEDDEKEPDDKRKAEEENDEEELLEDLHDINESLVGKIYRIQSYVFDRYSDNDMRISNFVSHMVIGINHDGTEDTMDLMQMVAPKYFKFRSDIISDYFRSNIYEYIKNKHMTGYSEKIRWKMKNIEERFRRPIKDYNGNSMGRRRTMNCKVLNPVELFGSRALDVYSTKYTDLDDKYGEIYEAFIKDPKNRICYEDLDMSVPIYHLTNSFACYSDNSDTRYFEIGKDGSCYLHGIDHTYGLAPVIRLGRSIRRV